MPSNLDLASNALGGALGAFLTLWFGARVLLWAARAQRELFAPLPHVDLGLVLIGLWLLTLLSPEIFLFSGGDLRQLLPIPPVLKLPPPSFAAMETVIVACHTLAIGLIVRALLGGQRSPFLVLPVFSARAGDPHAGRGGFGQSRRRLQLVDPGHAARAGGRARPGS